MPAQAEVPVSDPARDVSPRLALLVSAAVCPGGGHFIQRRWLLGALYAVAFFACVIMTVLAVIVPLMSNFRIALDMAEKGSHEPFRVISLAKVLTGFGLSALIYLAALADIVIYSRRKARQRLDERRKNLEQKD